MDGTEHSSTSKVVVQCVDPHNLYDSVEPHLSARSPLRNLHWKSPNRPLRSIPFLNVSLAREDTSAGSQSHIRRHQIPGLRQTPYVKLYLLRCDDKETYKEKVRKEVRQWVKTQTPAIEGKSSGKGQEDHDAFEWLIVHVVLPNTPAASQPQSAKHISLETTDSTDSVNSKSKWTGKSSSTIFDKLKADFNSSSKSGINRVAQVRLVESMDKSTALAPADIEEQWQDLIESLKACILRSFDARVAQYESDIRERDSQRNLPGWNFCTFFVLKEGLAKGFESVGLLDDALAIYNELSLGLDGLVKEQAQRIDSDDGGALLRFSKETKDLLRAALDPQQTPVSIPRAEVKFSLEDILNADADGFPFDVDRRKYLGLILSNEVSALDLRIYLFTRQMEILLRQGQADLSKSAHSAKQMADLTVIANLTERAIQSINLIARNLRLELYNAWGGQEGLSVDELHSQSTVTGNIVSTWEWRACMQVLARILPSLGMDRKYDTETLSRDIIEFSHGDNKRSPTQSEADRSTQRKSLAVAPLPHPHENPEERSKRGSLMPNGAGPRQSLLSRPGSEQLALWISRLTMLARRALETMETTRPWVLEMKQIAMKAGSLNETQAGSRVDSVHDSDEDLKEQNKHRELMAGVGSKTLQAAASYQSTFLNLYALLSILAYRTAVNAKNHATANQVLTNLVEMEYAQGNRTIAARYLHGLLGPLPRPALRPMDGYLLRIYADCLVKLERTNDYALCLISCLYWSSRCRAGTVLTTPLATNQSYVDRLFEIAPTLAPTTLPLTTLFHVSSVSRTISKLEDRDGFGMSIVIHSSAGTSTRPLKDIKMRLISKDGAEPRFLTLALREEASIESAGTTILLETSVTTYGWYIPDEIELRLGQLRLLHHFLPSHDEDFADSDDSALPRSNIAPVLVYPFFQSLEVRITPSPHIHLAQIRRLLVKIRPGANEVKQCKLRLKTATAGLRLNIHDARWLSGTRPAAALRTAREGDALMLVVDDLESGSLSEVEIPYTTEVASEPSVTLRIDANYETSQGLFTLYDTAFVNVILPVTVNVQDIIRSGYMYSRFTASPATLVPLHLVNCRLEDNDVYTADAGHSFPEPLVVFPKQPASWTVRLVPKAGEALKSTQRMTLSVDFHSLDEVILAALEESFTSAIMKTRYAYATRLLVTHLQSRIRAAWTEQDLEVAGLSQEVEVWNFEDMNWSTVLCAFDRQVSAEIEGWLQTWHADTEPIRLTPQVARQRQVKLYVDIPPPPVVVLAAIKSRRPHTATLGQPLMADLVISLGHQREEEEVEGAFEVAAPSDSWLIGGRRKGNVQLTRQPVRIPIVLFPQHLGHSLLPIISIKCRKWVEAVGSSSSSGEGWVEVPCEVHNATHGRSILVTPGLQSSTVEVFGAIPDEGIGRLIASKSR